jgi:hypothetical protein
LAVRCPPLPPTSPPPSRPFSDAGARSRHAWAGRPSDRSPGPLPWPRRRPRRRIRSRRRRRGAEVHSEPRPAPSSHPSGRRRSPASIRMTRLPSPSSRRGSRPWTRSSGRAGCRGRRVSASPGMPRAGARPSPSGSSRRPRPPGPSPRGWTSITASIPWRRPLVASPSNGSSRSFPPTWTRVWPSPAASSRRGRWTSSSSTSRTGDDRPGPPSAWDVSPLSPDGPVSCSSSWSRPPERPGATPSEARRASGSSSAAEAGSASGGTSSASGPRSRWRRIASVPREVASSSGSSTRRVGRVTRVSGGAISSPEDRPGTGERVGRRSRHRPPRDLDRLRRRPDPSSDPSLRAP